MADLSGRVLKKRYRIDAYLGRGGMAEVYRAFDTRRNYPVAIKVMHPDYAEDREFVRRFRQEAESLAALAHDNIVRFYSLEKDGSLIFLVMDYVEGITLRTLMAQEEDPLPFGQVAHIFGQVCQALHYAHEEGFVHRDVKPGNIMIRSDGRVLVADFGIAKATDSATITTYMPGTPAYMAPEQCRSEMVDPRSDVYSLGVVLFEMVTGRKPFLGEAEAATGSTREKMRWEQMYAPPPSPRALNPKLPAALERVILKALAKQPEGRFSTALELSEAFDIAAGDVAREAPPIPVESPPVGAATASPPVVEPVSEATSSTFYRWLRSAQANPTMATIVAVVGLAILGGGGWMLLSGPASPPTATEVPALAAAETKETPQTKLPRPSSTPTPENAVSITARLLRNADVHEGPGEEYAAFTRLDEETVVDVTGRNRKGTWWQIIHPAGPEGRGWIDADYAEMEGEGNSDRLARVEVAPPTAAPTLTVTPTPSATPLMTPTRAPMPTRKPTNTPILPTPTPRPPAATPIPVVSCPNEPQGEFHNVWEKHKNRLGCPDQVRPVGGFYAEQPFQNGHMFWSQLGALYLIAIGGNNGSWRLFFEDESPWKEGMPEKSCDAQPPPGLVQPVRGFGGLWCAHADIREQIGWGTDDERGFDDDLIQGFKGGIVFRDSDGHSRGLVYVLFYDDMSYIRDSY